MNNKNTRNYEFSLDYLNGVVPIIEVDSFFISLENICPVFSRDLWVKNGFAVRGIRNYSCRYHFQGKNNFIVSYNSPYEVDDRTACTPEQSRFNPYVYITVSGDGLRLFRGEQLQKFLKYLYRVGFKCSRLDIAGDFFNKDNIFVPMVTEAFRNSNCRGKNTLFISSSMSLRTKNGKRPYRIFEHQDSAGNYNYNIEFGNHGSSFGMFRLYDKFEQKNVVVPDVADPLFPIYQKLFPDDYWYRAEFEVHKRHSESLFNNMMKFEMTYCDVWTSVCVSMFSVRLSISVGYQTGLCPVPDEYTLFLKELSQCIHFVELSKEEKPDDFDPIAEKVEIFKHFSSLLCAYEDYVSINPSFRNYIQLNSIGYMKDRYKLFRDAVERKRFAG